MAIEESLALVVSKFGAAAKAKLSNKAVSGAPTTELLNVLHVLGRLVALEPLQADLLDRICAGPILSAEDLRAEGAFDVPKDYAAKASAKAAKADQGVLIE